MQVRITSGQLKGCCITVPHTDLRPTEEKVRAAFFNTLFSMIDFNDRLFLDIFSGTGAMGFEAVSRGFKRAVLVENDFNAVKQIKENVAGIGMEDDFKILKKDAFSKNLFEFTGTSFSAIYIDPPYKLKFKIPKLIKNLTDSEVADKVCVIGIESGESFEPFELFVRGWSLKEKKFGGTYLTFLYNWE